MKYTMTKKQYSKANGKWELENTVEINDYTIEQWENNILGSRDFFKKLGGKETLKGNTLTSVSPNGNSKSVYTLEREGE